MSEKLKLANGKEYELIPNGIAESDKKRSFKIVSTENYETIKAAFSTVENIRFIDFILMDGSTYKTYADSVALRGLSFDLDVKIDDNTTSDVYTVTLSTDAVEKAMQSLNSQIDDFANTIVMISML